MSKEGVIFLKILISELYFDFLKFLGVISLFKIVKRGLFACRTRGADVARHGTRGGPTRTHADACTTRTCGAYMTSTVFGLAGDGPTG